MATYGTDLTTITDAESSQTWTEMSTWVQGDTPTEGEGDYFIQGQSCASTDTNNKTGLASGAVDYGSDIKSSFTNGSTVVLIWHVLLPGNAMDTFANGGLRAIVGSSSSVFGGYKVGGNDFGRNPYGGWHCYAVDPSITPDYNVGSWTPGSSGSGYRYFGAAANLTAAISKGSMHGWDAMRYGRGEIYCTGTGATFAGLAQYNDYNDATNGYNRFGLFQAQGGIYLWKGLMSLGQSGTSVTFSDSDRTIIIDDTPAVYSSFNRLAIRNASSSVTWNNILFKALGTVSRGELEVVENATFAATGCSFQGMNTFVLLSNTTMTECIWKSCNLVTANGADLTGSKVLTPTVAADASAVNWNVATDPDGYLDDMTFSKGTNDHHAIEFGTSSPTSITLRGWVTTGFSASNGANSSTFYVARTGGTVTISVVGGSGNFTYKTAGATVSVVVDPVTVKVTCLDQITKAAISGAAVTLYAAGSGPWPYNASVSIVSSGGTATVTHTSHGLSTGDKVWIDGANQNEYNRIKTITVTGANTYTYPISGTPASPATGTITSTMVFIDEETPGTGIVSKTRVFSTDQAVAGYVSKGTTSPFYVRAELTGTVDSTDGLPLTAVMVRDGG